MWFSHRPEFKASLKTICHPLNKGRYSQKETKALMEIAFWLIETGKKINKQCGGGGRKKEEIGVLGVEYRIRTQLHDV